MTMIEHRPCESLGMTRTERIAARHHFCFAGYQHPERMSWGGLRVLNHSVLAPGVGSSPQPQDNMEMVQWVRRGVIAHAGSFGEKHRTLAGEVQMISPGAGITHNDTNPGSRPAEYLEIWITPDIMGGKPLRATSSFPSRQSGQLITLASGFPEDRDAMPLRASARVLGAKLPTGSCVSYVLRPGRHAYLVSASGAVDINGVRVGQRDGAAIHQESMLKITALNAAEIILIDVR
jgi:redox-sensitive bicupin YhaK (pirin superfamily)